VTVPPAGGIPSWPASAADGRRAALDAPADGDPLADDRAPESAGPLATGSAEERATPGGPDDPVWRAHFAAQCHDAAMTTTRAWTERRMRRLASSGLDLDGEDADSLVQSALCAVLAGDEPWDPARYTLGGYVFQIVRARLWRMTGPRGRVAAVRFDDLDDDTASEACGRGRSEAGASPEDALDASRAAAANRAMVDELRRLAADDPDVERAMNALADGARTPAEIVGDTGLTRRCYRAARARLDRLAKRLPSDLCARAGRRAPPAGAELPTTPAPAACGRRRTGRPAVHRVRRARPPHAGRAHGTPRRPHVAVERTE
jgi:hypothetical protein